MQENQTVNNLINWMKRNGRVTLRFSVGLR